MKHVLALLLAMAISAAPARANPDFDRWADGFSADWMRTNPQGATATQYFSGAAQDALDRELALVGAFGMRYGRKSAEESVALARRGLDELRRFPEAGLTAAQRTSAALIKWALDATIGQAGFVQQRFVFEQFG